jgi:predicted ester cyclase
MGAADDNRDLIRHIIETGFNHGDLSVADGRFRDDYVAHGPGVPALPAGPDGFKRVIGMWRTAFPDLHMTIEDMVCEGDLVANRFTTRGTHTGPLFGFEPTGNTIEIHGQELHRVQDGLVAESWICDDVPGLLVQLGLIDMPRPAAAAGPPPSH